MVFGGIVKVLASSTIRRAHNRAYSLENQFSRIVFLVTSRLIIANGRIITAGIESVEFQSRSREI